MSDNGNIVRKKDLNFLEKMYLPEIFKGLSYLKIGTMGAVAQAQKAGAAVRQS